MDSAQTPTIPNILLILDLNGILVDRASSRTFNFFPDFQRILYGFPPNVSIMIFTSITRKNAQPIIKKIEKSLSDFNFFATFYRDKCVPHPLRGFDDVPEWAIYKPLSKVETLFPTFDEFLLVDDEPYKMHGNHPSQYLICSANQGIDFLYSSILYRLSLTTIEPHPSDQTDNVPS